MSYLRGPTHSAHLHYAQPPAFYYSQPTYWAPVREVNQTCYGKPDLSEGTEKRYFGTRSGLCCDLHPTAVVPGDGSWLQETAASYKRTVKADRLTPAYLIWFVYTIC